MAVGVSINRLDAADKVSGVAKYTGDMLPKDYLTARIVRSTIANGLVKSFDLTEALAVPGVVKIVTCFDVPEIDFASPGHPWTLIPAKRDIADRRLLNSRVRIYGDEIAAVIASDEVAAARAVRLVKVEYEEYTPYVTVDEATSEGAHPVHDNVPNNVVVKTNYQVGDVSYDEAVKSEDNLILLDKTYLTQTVQHCHIEPPASFAYMADGKIVVVSSTQIPHIVRRVVGQALGISWGLVRIIKPYIGGGFGNKQEVLYEPLNAYLTTVLGGRCVKVEISREETFYCTRVRHAMRFEIKAAVRSDGVMVSRALLLDSNQGGYASHGHAVTANAGGLFKQLYKSEKSIEGVCRTIYTNISSGGAMRGYGIPQADFAVECMADDLALAVGMDPVEFRLKNCMEAGYEDPHSHITFYSYGLKDCIKKGRSFIKWDDLRAKYSNQTGTIRRGVGMAIFCYKTGVYPISLETSSCRMLLNQDGSVQLQMGATEIGQGADTVFSQMAAETLGITVDNIHIISAQDTDTAPFDTGAYASRQTYVSGKAVKKTAAALKAKMIDYASFMLKIPIENLDIIKNFIVDKVTKEELLPISELAVTSFYSLDKSIHLSSEETYHCKENTFSSGVCFAEIEVDMTIGKVKVLNIVNVHDSGILINPKLAEAQVHGGMSMGLGYALSEELMYDSKARPLNPNLLDYKLPTSMDTPNLHVLFVELKDPTGPYGNKSLGEPPAIPVAPAIRNAVLHATGVAFDSIPLSPQKLVEGFEAAGLI